MDKKKVVRYTSGLMEDRKWVLENGQRRMKEWMPEEEAGGDENKAWWQEGVSQTLKSPKQVLPNKQSAMFLI